MMVSSSRAQRAACAFVVALSAALGAYRLDFPGSWADEGYSLMEATGQSAAMPGVWTPETYERARLYVPDQIADPAGVFRPADLWRKNTPANVIAAAASFDNGNGSAHALLLHWWIRAFGLSNVAIRLPSVLFAAGTTLLVYLLVSRAMPTGRIAIVAAALTALSPMLIRASKIARAPSMAAFCIVGSLYFLYRMLRPGDASRGRMWVDAAAYGAFSAIAFFTHYFAVYVFMGQVLVIAVVAVTERRLRVLGGQLLVAGVVATGIAAPFLANGVWLGLQRGVAQEQARVGTLREIEAAGGSEPEASSILATPGAVAKQTRLLLANWFLVRSAAADTPWLRNPWIAALLLVLSVVTVGIYVGGLWRGYRLTPPAERLLIWLSAAIVAMGLVYTVAMSLVVMQTIIPFSTRSHVPAAASAAVLSALAIRGVAAWPSPWRAAALAVLLLQALVFNAVTLRSVMLDRYAGEALTRPTGNRQAAMRIRELHQPGDVVEYERWDDAVKVNLHLRGVDVMQRVDLSYLDRPLAEYERLRTIVLRRATGESVLLWQGLQDNGSLVPY